MARPWCHAYPPGVPPTLALGDDPTTVLLDRAARDHPVADGLVWGAARHSWSDLRDLVDRTAARLGSLGVSAGERVAVVAAPGPAVVVSLFATWRIGAVVVPIDPSLPTATLAARLATTEPHAVICDTGASQAVEDARPGLTRCRVVLVTEPTRWRGGGRALRALGVLLGAVRRDRRPASDGLEDLDEVLRAGPALVRQAPLSASDPAAIVWTAGTTGPARPVVLSHGNLVASATQLRAWLPDLRGGREALVVVRPPWTADGLGVGLLAGVAAAVRIVLPVGRTAVDDTEAGTPGEGTGIPAKVDEGAVAAESAGGDSETDEGADGTQAEGAGEGEPTPDGDAAGDDHRERRAAHRAQHATAAAVGNAVSAEGASVLVATPALGAAVARERTARRRLGSLRIAILLGGPAETATITRLEQTLPGVRVRAVHGSTETAGIVLAAPAYGEVGPGRLGVPVSGTLAVVASLDDGGRAATNEVGRLLVHGPQVMLGLWRGPDQPPESPGPWLDTGDLASVDDAGVFTVHGRTADLVATPGGVVVPSVVEDALRLHPRVGTAALVAVPAADGTEQVVAAVTRAGLVRPRGRRLREHLVGRLAEHEIPDRVVVLPRLPRTLVGAIDRRALRSLLAEAAADEAAADAAAAGETGVPPAAATDRPEVRA